MKTDNEYINNEFLWRAYRDDPDYLEIIKKIKKSRKNKKEKND